MWRDLEGLESVASKHEACLVVPLTAAVLLPGCVIVASGSMCVSVEVEKATCVVQNTTMLLAAVSGMRRGR